MGETYTKVFGRLGPAAYASLREQELLDNAKQGLDELAIGFESHLQNRQI